MSNGKIMDEVQYSPIEYDSTKTQLEQQQKQCT